MSAANIVLIVFGEVVLLLVIAAIAYEFGARAQRNATRATRLEDARWE